MKKNADLMEYICLYDKYFICLIIKMFFQTIVDGLSNLTKSTVVNNKLQNNLRQAELRFATFNHIREAQRVSTNFHVPIVGVLNSMGLHVQNILADGELCDLLEEAGINVADWALPIQSTAEEDEAEEEPVAAVAPKATKSTKSTKSTKLTKEEKAAEKARIQAEKDAEKARIQAEKDAEKARILAEKAAKAKPKAAKKSKPKSIILVQEEPEEEAVVAVDAEDIEYDNEL